MSEQLPTGVEVVSKAKVADTTVTTVEFKTLQELEVEHIETALQTFGNNKSAAAKALGVTTKTLYNKLHEYGLFEKYSGRRV